MDYSGHESIGEPKSYLERTLDMVILGSYTDEFTWLGLGIQLGLGFFNLDFPCDVRDFTADITVNQDMTALSRYGMMALDAVALFPVIGEAKYLDDLAYGVKMLFKNGDELIDGGKCMARAADALHDLSKKGRTVLNDMADTLRGMSQKVVKNADILNDAKYVDDVANAASDAGKKLDDFAGNYRKVFQYVSELSDEQIEALIKYTGDDYANINNSLRGIETLTPENRATVETMKSALDNSALPQDMILYRGTSIEALGSLQNLPTDELVGKTFMEHGFMSTSTSSVVGESFSKTMLMTIEAPKGAQALDISSISQFTTEAEVLFNTGQEMMITSAEVKNGILYITVTIE